MEKKQLIILTGQPFTNFISQRFGSKINRKNWEKKYLYILPLLNKNLYKRLKAYGFRHIKDKNFYTITSFKSLFFHIKKLNFFFYINTIPGFFISEFIEIIFKLHKGQKIIFKHGYTLGKADSFFNQLYDIAKFDLLFSIKKIFFSFFTFTKKAILKIFYINPDFIFCANQINFDNVKLNNIQRFRINSFDYNKFLLKNLNKKKQIKNQIVFLDSNIEDSYENRLLGLKKNYFDKSLYWKTMLKIFEKIEKQNDNRKIIIAAHMRRNIDDQPINRKFIFDKTIDLIKNSKLVIAHNSLSLQWAILFKKPIILIYQENFKYLALENTREINNLSKILDLKLIIVDKNFQINFNNINIKKKIKVNYNKYNHFIKKYINFSSLIKKPKHPYETILETIDKY